MERGSQVASDQIVFKIEKTRLKIFLDVEHQVSFLHTTVTNFLPPNYSTTVQSVRYFPPDVRHRRSEES